MPVNELSTTGQLPDWALIGPFDQEKIKDAAPDEPSRDGFHKDYLGGEAAFALKNLEPLALASGDVKPRPATVKANGRVSFNEAYGKDYAVAYAYCLVESPTDQEVTLGFGSDDSAKVWLNGELVLEEWVPSRGTREDATMIPVPLRAGPNRLLVKVEDAVLGWDFQLNLYTPQAIALKKAEAEKQLAAQFEPVAKNRWGGWTGGHLIQPGKFPEIAWRYPGLVEKHFGEMPVTVRWFDNELNEVEQAKEPGRYLAVVETSHPENGLPVRRGLSFYAHPANWEPWLETFSTHAEWQPFPGGPFNPEAMAQRREQVGQLLASDIWFNLQNSSPGAAVVAYLAELEPSDGAPQGADDPHIINLDKFAALKRQLAATGRAPTPLAPPKGRALGATILDPTALRDGSLAEAGFTPGLEPELRAICEEWAANPDNGPFSLLVARNGVVVFHEVFNSPGWPERTLDSKFGVASITKAVSGLLLARYVDAKLIGLDDPVGRYLPDIPAEGDGALKVRHLVNHTSGLEGHWGFGQGGPFNPFLENLAAHQLQQTTTRPGTAYLYNGNGFNLAGRVMEAVSGKSVQRSFQEDLFEPLGIEGAEIIAMGTSGEFSAVDLAKFGMLLANRGTYGGREFFREEISEQLLPVPLRELDPAFEGDHRYGVGLSWMQPKTPSEEAKALPYGDEKMLGHGSATASILQVGMDSGIVITGGRAIAGTDPGVYVQRIVDTVHRHAIPDEE
ncbi:MAG: serine hydrolase [Verrucomicrobiota bacterium]